MISQCTPIYKNIYYKNSKFHTQKWLDWRLFLKCQILYCPDGFCYFCTTTMGIHVLKLKETAGNVKKSALALRYFCMSSHVLVWGVQGYSFSLICGSTLVFVSLSLFLNVFFVQIWQMINLKAGLHSHVRNSKV